MRPGNPFTVVRLWPDQLSSPEVFARVLEMLKRCRPICDEVWMATARGYPPLDVHRRYAGQLADAAEMLRRSDILPGMQVGNTLGHAHRPELPTAGTGAQRMVGHDGASSDTCFCPRSGEFRAYFRSLGEIYGAVRPSSIWLDDDMRLNQHPPVAHGCFCDGCLSAFSAETDRRWDRPGLAAALNSPEEPGELRLRWTRFGARSLADLARAFSEGVAASGADCRVGLQQVGLEWSCHSGPDWAPVLRAMSEATGRPAGSRPGHGFYDDHRPRGMIVKSLMIARQNAALPDCVDVVPAEVENYPHGAAGKTAHGTALEASLHLAMGCNSLSFAVLCAWYEPIPWYSQLLERLAAWRPFWERAARACAGTHPGGLEVRLGRDRAARPLGPGERPFAWTAAPVEYTYGLACLGLPLCAGPQAASGVLLCPEAAEGMTDAELERVFSGGVLTDGPTVRALHDRGLGALTGMRARQMVDSGLADRLALRGDPEADGPASDWRCRHYFSSSGVFVLEEFSASSRVLSHLCDEAGRQLGASCVLTRNSLGGKVAVIGCGLWSTAISARLQSRLLTAADWASDGKLPLVPDVPAQVVLVPRATTEGRLRGVFVLNPTIDALPGLRLRLRGTRSSRATWLRPEAEPRALDLRPAHGEQEATLPEVPPWSAAWLLLD
ncbi:MAG: hypothetical protein ACYTGB_08480 [Planctomycetota bacterium]|jgi:hypothetical protein